MAKKPRAALRIKIRVGQREQLFTKSQIGRLFTAAQAFAQAELDLPPMHALTPTKLLDAESVLIEVCKEVNIVS